MNRIFDDATSTTNTSATRGETDSLTGEASPIPPADLGQAAPDPVEDGLGSSRAIPDLDIDPPNVHIRNGMPQYSHASGEGVGGWISRIVTRGANRSRYKPLDQQHD